MSGIEGLLVKGKKNLIPITRGSKSWKNNLRFEYLDKNIKTNDQFVPFIRQLFRKGKITLLKVASMYANNQTTNLSNLYEEKGEVLAIFLSGRLVVTGSKCMKELKASGYDWRGKSVMPLLIKSTGESINLF